MTGYSQEEMDRMADAYFSSILPAKSGTRIKNELNGDYNEWVYPGLLCMSYTMLVGAPKAGKSWVAVNIAAAVSRGEPALGIKAVKPLASRNVLIVTTEGNGESENTSRLDGLGADLDHVFIDRIPRGGDVPEQSYLAAEYGNLGLVIVDNVGGILRDGVSLNDAEATNELNRIAERFNIAKVPVLFIHHTNKGNSADPVRAAMGNNTVAGFVRHLVGVRASKSGTVTLTTNGNISSGFDGQVSLNTTANGKLSVADDSVQQKPRSSTDDAERQIAEIACSLPGGLSKIEIARRIAEKLKNKGVKSQRGDYYQPDTLQRKLNSMPNLIWDKESGFRSVL